MQHVGHGLTRGPSNLLSELLPVKNIIRVSCLRAQLYSGCVQETLSVDIKPGWKGGTRITFDGKGALRAACIAAGKTSKGHAGSAHSRCRAHVHLCLG